jgi:hypothetical protein
MAKKLEEPARSTAQSLAKALAADDGPNIMLKFTNLQRMVGKNFGNRRGQILALLNDDQVARLARMTSFEL